MNKAGTQRIETDRLILRRFRVEDAEDILRVRYTDSLNVIALFDRSDEETMAV